MRFDLKVPYAQKDAAKALGARWDAARKIWYVNDPADPSAFERWAPSLHAAVASIPASAEPGAAAGRSSAVVRHHAGVFTGPTQVLPLCDCQVLPWAHCMHSQRDA